MTAVNKPFPRQTDNGQIEINREGQIWLSYPKSKQGTCLHAESDGQEALLRTTDRYGNSVEAIQFTDGTASREFGMSSWREGPSSTSLEACSAKLITLALDQQGHIENTQRLYEIVRHLRLPRI